MRVLREGREDWLEDFIGQVSSSPFVWFGKCREEGARHDVLSGGSQWLEVMAQECFSNRRGKGKGGASRDGGSEEVDRGD